MALLNFDISVTPAAPLEPAPAPKPRDSTARRAFEDHLDRARRSGDQETEPEKPTNDSRPSSVRSAKAKPRQAEDDRRDKSAVEEAPSAKDTEKDLVKDVPAEANSTGAAVVVTPVVDAALAEVADEGEKDVEADATAKVGDAPHEDSAANHEQAVEAASAATAVAAVEILEVPAAAESTASDIESVPDTDSALTAKPIVSPLHAKGHAAAQATSKTEEVELPTANANEAPSGVSPSHTTAGQLAATPVAENEVVTPAAKSEPQSTDKTGQPIVANVNNDAASMPVVAPVAPAPPQASGTPTDGTAAEKATERIEPAPADATDKQPSPSGIEPPSNHPPRLPVGLNPHGKSGGDESGGLTEVQRVRFVQRVARAFQTIGDSGNPLRLRLSPPELGSLRLEITMNQGQMTARVEAETEAARTVLLDNLPALRERLAQQDIKIARFDVDLFGQTSGGLPQNQERGPASDDGSAASGSRRRPSGSGERVTLEIGPRAPANLSDGRLNVII